MKRATPKHDRLFPERRQPYLVVILAVAVQVVLHLGVGEVEDAADVFGRPVLLGLQLVSVHSQSVTPERHQLRAWTPTPVRLAGRLAELSLIHI